MTPRILLLVPLLLLQSACINIPPPNGGYGDNGGNGGSDQGVGDTGAGATNPTDGDTTGGTGTGKIKPKPLPNIPPIPKPKPGVQPDIDIKRPRPNIPVQIDPQVRPEIVHPTPNIPAQPAPVKGIDGRVIKSNQPVILPAQTAEPQPGPVLRNPSGVTTTRPGVLPARVNDSTPETTLGKGAPGLLPAGQTKSKAKAEQSEDKEEKPRKPKRKAAEDGQPAQ